MIKRNRIIIISSLIVTLFIFLVLFLQNTDEINHRQSEDFSLNDTKTDKEDGSYGVTSDSEIATEVGMKVLEQGGNAVDAAVAVSYALGVAEPHGSGIGGGGTMLIHPQKGSDHSPVVYDYRETAPSSKSVPESGTGVPGFVAGMNRVHDDFGTMKMEQLIEPSIYFAKNGIVVSETMHQHLEEAKNRMPNLGHMYPDGDPIEAGEILIQKQLADTLTRIQQDGPSAFYSGDISESINEKESKIDKDDLESYKVEVKKPIEGEFGDYDVLAPPPPSGGIMLLQNLKMAEMLKAKETKEKPLDFTMLMGMINRASYKDRLENVGDPEFNKVPVKKMLSEDNLRNLTSDIGDGTKLSDEYLAELDSDADLEDHENTTHFVVVDHDGMMVSVTNTLSKSFGSGIYVDGFFLNNQLKNFSNNENSPNSPEPGKRPFSYTTPTILAKNGKPVIGIGASGGRRITSMVTQELVKMIKFNEPVQESVEQPRSFLEFNENALHVESDYVFLEDPEKRGININNTDSTTNFGNVQGLVIDHENNKIYGASDPRRNGSWDSKD
ncbi:gamma-glutamyltransferase [Alteribacter keqinensis]|uniref:Glutathione hydrolase proenzyme n=1 Tax=Alteribacter keqinensis TaxID=2483800 RepID=A0A3M7TPX0_9BACI|nr:gamma-glutamyltransferase [Alteribacter keqinensis]RNA67598.1 gamma-glutamyltransferase [Alteribacter keqinensis]